MTEKELEKFNVKIAKKLGWKKFKRDLLPYPMHKEKRTMGIAPGNFRHQFVPNFFGNLAYAMKLVDWAIDHRYKFELFRDTGSRYYGAKFYDGKRTLIDFGTLPSVAICMAFQKIK